MESKEVDLREQGSGTKDTLAVGVEVAAENVDQASGVLSLSTRSGSRVDILANGLPGVLLESLDNLGRLYITLATHLKQRR